MKIERFSIEFVVILAYIINVCQRFFHTIINMLYKCYIYYNYDINDKKVLKSYFKRVILFMLSEKENFGKYRRTV